MFNPRIVFEQLHSRGDMELWKPLEIFGDQPLYGLIRRSVQNTYVAELLSRARLVYTCMYKPTWSRYLNLRGVKAK